MTRKLPEYMTVAQVVEETGLPEPTVRNLLRRVPKVPTPMRTVLVKRADVFAALDGKYNR